MYRRKNINRSHPNANKAIDLIRERESDMRWTGEKDLSINVQDDDESDASLLDTLSSEHGFSGDVFVSYTALTEQSLDIKKEQYEAFTETNTRERRRF